MSNEVINPAGSAVALPSDYLSSLAADAKEASAQERPAIGRISLKAGVMSYGGNPIAGNKMEAIVLAAGFRNVWYAGRYDANNVVNPNCFALSMTDEDMVPHANVVKPEHPTCEGCPHNEWGSDPNGGRGKACKQTRRLVLMPATVLEDKEDVVKAIKAAELALMDLPVTSVKNYSQFVNVLTATAAVPPFAAVAQVSVVPDAKTQFKVLFKPMQVLPSVEIIEAVKSRLEQAKGLSIEPYETSNTEEAEAEKAAAKKPNKKF